MTDAIATDSLTMRFGRRAALSDCTVRIPAGSVTGLIGANGAGKSTLLKLAAGLLRATDGKIEVLGSAPSDQPAQLARVGFVAQDTPLYGHLSVAEHLRLGRKLNRTWDSGFVRDRVDALGLDPGQKAARLSGGQRAQLALTLALAKRPELLLLDEPAASLDPLARREFLKDLMSAVAEHGATVILSSHLVSDLERVCDHAVVLAHSRVLVAGGVDDLLATHHRVVGPARDTGAMPFGQELVCAERSARLTSAIVRSSAPVGTSDTLSLEDVVLAYMAGATS